MKATIVIVLLAIAGITTVACGKQESMVPDISLNFECANGSPSEAAIETFLRQHNFDVANLERVRRQFHRDFFPMDIEAVDKRSWTIEFRGFNIPATPASPERVYYSAAMYSPPPTRHDRKLEDVIEAFVMTTLECKVTSFARNSNSADAMDFFNYVLALQKSRMHEAEICDRTTSTYDAAECAKVPGVEQ